MTGALAAFHFVRPGWLLLLGPALALWALHRRAAMERAPWRGVIDPVLLRHLIIGGEGGGHRLPAALLLTAEILGIMAVAGPVWRRTPSPFADAKPPVMILLRVTPSMEKTDLAPTRLARAVQKISDLLALREGAPTGLIAYAGSAHLVLPPTPDGAVVLAMAQALSPAVMPREGDDLTGAIAMARRVLAQGGRGGSVLVAADAATAEGLDRLPNADEGPAAPPTILFAMRSPEAAEEPDGLSEAARTLGATLIAARVDDRDVRGIAGRLDRASAARDVRGEGEGWQEAGYWMTPLLLLLVLPWFRRGWVLA